MLCDDSFFAPARIGRLWQTVSLDLVSLGVVSLRWKLFIEMGSDCTVS